MGPHWEKPLPKGPLKENQIKFWERLESVWEEAQIWKPKAFKAFHIMCNHKLLKAFIGILMQNKKECILNCEAEEKYFFAK